MLAGAQGVLGSAAQEEHLLLEQNTPSVGLCHATLALSLAGLRVSICGLRVSDCAQTPRVPSTSQSLACWPRECEERGTGASLAAPALAASQVEAWLEGYASAGSAGPAGDLKMLCSFAVSDHQCCVVGCV